jgi:DNA invertase Pin-like site-specific DNA recombinase
MTAKAQPRIRCAIYTRKSSEEGLEHSFNSLDAQREACEAFVASQRHEGWHALPAKYDDGGYSGGNMNRPGLKQLLEDIAARRVDVVVVYKVDRLTRSLADFAKIIDVFDEKSVSFVSVTQQFNTTTSMGRLTLNVLLSFAQFEREVTGERIRDKIAASKKKGMWMGGVVPLGYDLKGRQLVLNTKEAKLVQEIFSQYLRLGSVAELMLHLKQARIRTKIRTSVGGRTFGGKAYSRGGLYKLLKNEVYIGKIPHRGESYAGQHPAIIDQATWEKVLALLAANNQGQRGPGRKSTPSLLTGMVFDADGHSYTPTHAVSKGKRYRYYTSQAIIHGERKATYPSRLPAHELERLVTGRVQEFLQSPEELYQALSDADVSGSRLQRNIASAQQLSAIWAEGTMAQQASRLKLLIKKIVLDEKELQIQLDVASLAAMLDEPILAEPQTTGRQQCSGPERLFTLTCDLRLSHCRGELRLVLPSVKSTANPSQQSILRAIARAVVWKDRIISGEVYCKEQIADETGLNAAYVGRILRLGALSPELVDAVCSDQGYVDRPLEWFVNRLPLEWDRQQEGLLHR